jgi:hypothetical protein
MDFVSFDVSSHVAALRAGPNVLALHGLNESASSSDFLISAELVGGKGPAGSVTPSGVSPTALRYTGPITLDRSAPVRARTLSNGVWSALNEAVYAVGPVAESLRVSEIMYHPASEISDLKSQISEAEYLELTNVGSQTINLSMVRFTDGIGYTFPSFELPPGGYCLLVKDIAAFEAVYGSKLPVVGEYAGSLSNGGEKIQLVDATGGIVQGFTYKDSWFDLTDGLGLSLTVFDPQGDGNDPANWRAMEPSPGR